MIFGRASEEIAACRGAGIPVEVVPGISAAQGAASRLGISLTNRQRARRVQFVTGHGSDGRLPDDIDWASLADPAATTVVYMPARTLAAFATAATAHGLDAATPAIAVAHATRADETVVAAPIAELAERLAAADLGRPVIVMFGRVFAEEAAATAASDTAASRAADSGSAADRANWSS